MSVMNETDDLKAAVILLAELVREETHYNIAVGRMLTAVTRSILDSSDEIRNRYEKHFEQIAFPLEPQSSESPLHKIDEMIRQLDGILQRMKS
jgi:hypothetical protein